MANNDITQYEKIKGLPEREFYDLFELYEDRMERLKQQAEAQARK